VTTPPNPPDDNENVYGGPPPSGQNPYGQTPYGGTPYPGGGEYGAQPVEKKTDGVSIAAFVTGLVCCAPVGVILGIIGIARTKNGQRKGRWAAVTGIVLGVLGIVAWVGLAVGGVWIFENTIRPDNAEVGQCVDIEDDGGEVSMLKKDCTEDHDGEIVGVEKVDSENREAIETGMADFCAEVVSAEDLTTIFERGDLELNAVIEDPDNVENGDTLVCYAQATEGKLDEKILE
jgi:hypothetical protein